MAGKRLGVYLRSRREARGVSVEALARATRIPPRILEAMEQDRLRELPAPVFVRGFIRAYLRQLGDSPREALALYEAWVAAHTPREAPPPPRFRLHPPLVAAALLLLVLAAGLYLVAPRPPGNGPGPAERVSSRAPDLAPSAGGLTAGTPTRPLAGEPSPGARGAAVVGEDSEEHRLVVRARELTWVRVETGAGTATEALLAPGETREWRSSSRFVLTVGNAGGVSLELNGEPLPPLGASGEVVRELVLPLLEGS
ncbi:MAG: DUF4115 domain-containing protein [Candidatus Rokubacteria bacterium]|nr:DUF4115 domain-containing protein [Candidatus Rokubacteria bacterium]